MLFKNDFYYCNSDTTMVQSCLPLIYYLCQGQTFNVIWTCLLFSMYERSIVNIRAFDSAFHPYLPAYYILFHRKPYKRSTKK